MSNLDLKKILKHNMFVQSLGGGALWVSLDKIKCSVKALSLSVSLHLF